MVSNQVENPDIEVQDPPKENAPEIKAEKTVRRRAASKTAEKKDAAAEKSDAHKTSGEEKPKTRSVRHRAVENTAEKAEDEKKESVHSVKPAEAVNPKISAAKTDPGEQSVEKPVRAHTAPKPDFNTANKIQDQPPAAPDNAGAAPNAPNGGQGGTNAASGGGQNSSSGRPAQNYYKQQPYNKYNNEGGNNYSNYRQSNSGANNNNNNNYNQTQGTGSGSAGGSQNQNPNQSQNFSAQQAQNQQNAAFQQHQYVEMARGFTIQDLNKKNVSELFQIAQDLNITPHLHKRTNTLIMRIMHEQIKRAGGYAAEGVLDILEDGYGFLRTATYSINEKDVYVSPSQIRRFDLRTGDVIIGQTRAPKEGEKFAALLRVEAINFEEPEKIKHRKNFDTLVPYYPNEKFTLEKKADYGDLSTRIVDLISPVGKGQRGLIVAPPKAGKTTLLKSMANSIIENHPEVEVMILLIDERPEEVTDMQRSVNAEVISSTFDEPLEHHIRVSELTLEKAKRMVENNKHVVILLDSITRLARAYNLHLPSSGQTLTGGVNPAALYKPKKFFGAARNIEGGGSLTILATALVETGSKLDDIIFEEFKGTGNMELILDRKLFEKRLFPCMDIKRTGTRKEELLLDKDTLNKVWILRKILEPLSPAEAMQLMVDRMSKTKRNKDFLESMHVADAN